MHFGAIARRLADDVAATLVHDIERTWDQKEVLSALAFDIKCAFDTVTEKRLSKRLWEQKIPLPLIRWVRSFLTERRAAIRLDGNTGAQEAVKIGIPQGLPTAPILFMLFTTPLFKLFSNEKKKAGVSICGYVDDGLITGWGSSESKCITWLTEAFNEVESWAYENGMVFDSAKYKAIHFSRKKHFPNSPIHLPGPPFSPNAVEPRIIRPINKHSSMRWLEAHFDSQLSFKEHISKMASKGRKVVARLKMLANTIHGVEPLIMRKAIHACILPILTYGAPTWCSGRTRLNREGKTICNGIDNHLKQLDKVQNIALRTILPV